LIDEALADAKKDPREKQDIVMMRLVDFYNWLQLQNQHGEERVALFP